MVVSAIPTTAAALSSTHFNQLRRRMMFDCQKWDPQVEDVTTLTSFPLILASSEWAEVARLAEALAAETLAMEQELAARPDLLDKLGLPASIKKLFARDAVPSRGAARLVRFDFHLTDAGWKISEANTDVPGGFIEASGFTALMAKHYPGLVPAGDPTESVARRVAESVGANATIALVHATAYTDDRQVMIYLGKRLESFGLQVHLVSPGQLAWENGHARLSCAWAQAPVDFVIRFFPAEWLQDLPSSSGWRHYFVDSRTPQCNPATALLVQSKRLPLVWDSLRASSATWKQTLPETFDPRLVPWEKQDGWILKPAFGRVGEGVAIAGATDAKDLASIRRDAKKHPGDWVAQRRFSAVPVMHEGLSYYPCLGVYTVDGKAAGAYGRIAPRPLIDHRAQDVAVLIQPDKVSMEERKAS
jgi:glutathionylspermidine synthase